MVLNSVSFCLSVKLLISPSYLNKDFPGGSDGKASAYNAGDPVQSLGWEDPLENKTATHSRTLAWKIPWM